jgi:Amt family ammonium transporter
VRVILWFGWYGFNPGSTLSAMDAWVCPRRDEHHARRLHRRPERPVLRLSPQQEVGLRRDAERPPRRPRGDHLPLLLGLAHGCLILGAVAGVVCIYAVDLLEWLRIDDPVGAWPVHGACGIWGTLSLLLVAQLIGSASITAATFAVSMAMFYAVKATGTLRVSREGELEGLDLHEHGAPAYPELLLSEAISPPSKATTGVTAGAPAVAE